MMPLVGIPAFEKFMELVDEMREQSIAFAASGDGVRNQRETLAALGEVRCYSDLMALHTGMKMTVEERADEEQRRRESDEQA